MTEPNAEPAGENVNLDVPLRPVSGVKPPAPLAIDTHMAENWRLFKQKWNNYAILTGLETQKRQYQVALLLHTLGDEALKIYNGFQVNEDTVTVDDVIACFEQFAVGQVNETYERFIFNKRVQAKEETVENFLASIRSLVKTCNYCETCVPSILRDRIVVGIRNPDTQSALLKEKDLTLDAAVQICKAAEGAASQVKVLQGPESVYKVVKPKQHNTSKQCKFCGFMHELIKSKCPAWGKTCKNCMKQNHFAKMCGTLNKDYSRKSTKKNMNLQGQNEAKGLIM